MNATNLDSVCGSIVRSAKFGGERLVSPCAYSRSLIGKQRASHVAPTTAPLGSLYRVVRLIFATARLMARFACAMPPTALKEMLRAHGRKTCASVHPLGTLADSQSVRRHL